MKTFKFLMPFLLVAFTFVGCNTDDLRNDIDELKNRVESLEAQVSAFNDNINALKVLIDGKLTIQEVKEENGVYTLLLSNEQTITLKQGDDFSAPQEPEVTINNGNWVINGTDTGCPVAGDVPEFRIENNYWEIKIDGNWQRVKDANGNDVKAVSDGTQTGGNSFFESVEYDEAEGVLNIVLKENSQSLSLPVVQNLVCAIKDKTSLKNGNTLVVGYGEIATLDVTIKGDNAFVTAPSGWIATLSEPDTNGKATLTVKAPAKADASTMSRATADNSKDLTVQVNKGVNWAVDKIQVEAGEVIESYYALYQQGKTLKLAGLEINKEKYGEAVLVNSADAEIKKETAVYFIEPSIEFDWKSTENFPNMILIGNNSSVKSKMKPTGQFKLQNNNADGLFLAYNLEINTTAVYTDKSTYLLAQNADNAFGTAVFYDSKIICLAGQALTYISTPARSFKDFRVENCRFEMDKGTHQQWIISVSSSTATYEKITFKNNIFYCNELGLTSNFKLFNGNKASINDIAIENNSFINLGAVHNGSATGLVYADKLQNTTIKNNIFYSKDGGVDSNYIVYRITSPISAGVEEQNIYYRNDGYSKVWQYFYSSDGVSCGWAGAGTLTKIDDDPFVGGTFTPSTGTFIPNSTYSAYGATIE